MQTENTAGQEQVHQDVPVMPPSDGDPADIEDKQSDLDVPGGKGLVRENTPSGAQPDEAPTGN